MSVPNRTLPALVYLLLHRGEPIARTRLAALLRPDDAEAGARTRLRANLHALLAHLPPPARGAWLERDNDSVCWNPSAPLWLDVAAFEDLARDPARFADAAALYRGDLAEDLDAPWIGAERERLRAVLVGGLEAQLERQRDVRAFAAARATAERLLAIDPWREDIVRRLIALHYESGDRAAALSTFDAFAVRVRGEFASEPMAETVMLREAIERGAALGEAREAAVATALRPPRAQGALPFIGRRAEFAALAERWERAARGQGGTLLVGGEAGIGKTRLTCELERHVADGGGRVLRGATSTPEAAPYQAFVEALRGALPLLRTASLAPPWLGALGGLLPELADGGSTAPARESDPQRERQRVLEAIARALSALAAPRPLLLILEDVHWANDATLAALEFVARRIALVPLLIVATHREEETTPAHPLRRVRRELQAQGLAEHVALAALSVDDVGALLARLPARPGANAAALYERSGGNPLFLTHIVASLGEGDLDSVPPALRTFFATRLERLPDASRTIVEIAALAGRQFPLELLQDVTGWSEAAVLAALDDLIERRLVREIGLAQRFEYGFTHHLVLAAVRETIDERSARHRHRRIAALLEKQYPHGDADGAALLAFHHARAGDHDAAARRYLDAAERARSLGAHDDALERLGSGLALGAAPHLRAALLRAREALRARLGDRDGQAADLDALDAIALASCDGDLACDVLYRRAALAGVLGARDEQRSLLAALRERVAEQPAWRAALAYGEAHYFERLGLFAQAESAANAAIDAYRRDGEHQRVVHLLCMIARMHAHREDPAQCERALAAAAALASSPEAERLVLEERTCIAVSRDDREGRAVLCRKLIELSRSLGDRSGEALAFERLGIALLVEDRFSEAAAAFDEAAAIAEAVDDRQRRSTIMVNRAHFDMILGAFDDAAANVERALAITRARGEEMFALSALNNLSAILTLSGDAVRAKAFAEQALARATELGSIMYQATALENVAEADAALGNVREAIAAMESSLERRRANGVLVSFAHGTAQLAQWYLASGDAAAARVRIERMLASEETIPRGSPWPQQCYWLAARVLRACGETARARGLLDRAYAMTVAKARACPDERRRETFLAIAGHREIVTAHEHGAWPEDAPPAEEAAVLYANGRA